MTFSLLQIFQGEIGQRLPELLARAEEVSRLRASATGRFLPVS